MRSEWIPLSASSLVVGVMALVLGSLLVPQDSGGSSAQTIRLVAQNDAQYLGASVMFFGAAAAMILGLPALLSLFTDRGRRTGLVATGVLAIGVIGIAGYAMLLVFFRALVNAKVITDDGLDRVVKDPGLLAFLYGWLGGFYLGLLLVAIALLVARKTPVWVPVVLMAYVALFPLSSHIGKVGQVLQLMGLAAAFTGVAVTAVNRLAARGAVEQPF